MSDHARIVLGLLFIICVYALTWWLMRIALRPPTGFWAMDRSDDQDEDPQPGDGPGPVGPTK